jgi:thioredoxin reductase (NADPH)
MQPLDCLIVGAGPAGLAAALYLARFGRRVAIVDAGRSRAARIPQSHNIPFFSEGISGSEILGRQRDHLARYGLDVKAAEVTRLACDGDAFAATFTGTDGAARGVAARRVLLATGADDVEPELPGLPDAVRRGLVRYCPICDGFEAGGRTIGVIGHGSRGLGEAVFIARTYSRHVTLMTLGQPMAMTREERERVAGHDVTVIEDPVVALERDGDRIVALRTGAGHDLRFEVLYSALGRIVRSGLARRLGARHDDTGALIVDDHNRTSVPGLYAAGDVVSGLDQVIVAMAHAAVAATDIHNRCEWRTDDGPGGDKPG